MFIFNRERKECCFIISLEIVNNTRKEEGFYHSPDDNNIVYHKQEYNQITYSRHFKCGIIV